MKELWKDIKGYENHYQISNIGRVKGVERKVKKFDGEKTIKEKIKIQQTDKDGYKKVALYKKGKSKIFSVHRLVAIAFIKNIYNKKVVNHKDGKKENNNVNNLEWVTISENTRHSFVVLGRKPNKTMSGKCGKLNHKSKAVNQICLKTNKIIAQYESINIAKKQLNIHHIASVCRGERKHAGGFKWEFI